MIAGLIARARSLWRGLHRRDDLEGEMAEEFRLHVERRADDLIRAGLPPAEARRRARLEFGPVEHYRAEGRASRGLDLFDHLTFSWLDVKLGIRMLLKYPGLTLVGGLGIAAAVAVGAALFVATRAIYATLPLPEGDRVVAIETWDREWNNQERRILHDFVAWRDQLRSVQDLGAFRDVDRNLIVDGTYGEPVRLAEITPSAFALARVPALVGRPLVTGDEQPSAPPVVLIGYDIWLNQFAADPNVVGRDIRLGKAVHTVVGVMPKGFAFPISHGLWVPLRYDVFDYERRRGPGIMVFGRLAPGATIEQARTELDAIASRMATAFPDTHARLSPRIMPYAMQLYDDMEGWEFPFLYLVVTTLLVVVCVNVAILVYARTATRHGEIAMRTALGASRRRIVTQLFGEALVLSGVAAAVGLAVAAIAVRQVDAFLRLLPGGVPFWVHFGVSPGMLLYGLALAVAGAAIVGVVPAIKATGRRMQGNLQHLAAGSARLRMGRTWTALIVSQIAVTVAVLPLAVSVGRMAVTYGLADPGFAADQFLTAQLQMDAEAPPSEQTDAYQRAFALRYRELEGELLRRLEAEPSVRHVIVTSGPPGMEPPAWIEVEGLTDVRHQVGIGRVSAGFFEAFDVPVLRGRGFDTQDAGRGVAIVNQSFAQLLGGNALGRRFRHTDRGRASADQAEEPWYVIVGVVGDFSNKMEPDLTRAKAYHAIAPGDAYPSRLAIRIEAADPLSFVPRLREITTALDPSLKLRRVLTLEQVMREEQGGWRVGGWALGFVTLSVLLLAAAGIYAMMSFAVTQRRREIGIRAALGAHPHRLLASIFARAVCQLGLGVAAGLAIAALVDYATGGEVTGGLGVSLLAGVAAFMMAVSLGAALGPARRGLRIQPTEALREE